MDSKKTTPALRLVTVNSDESTVLDPTRVVALLNPDTGRYLDGVTVTLQLLDTTAFEQLEKKHRTPEKTPKGVEWKTDTKSLVLEVLVKCVQSWTGIVGADNKPMPVCGAALKALDDNNKLHLFGVARTPAEMVDAEVVVESFREPAGVGPVAH